MNNGINKINPHQRCYRCQQLQPLSYFEPPITICLPCYAAITTNHGLSIDQLRAKAHRSRKARKFLKSVRDIQRTRAEADLISEGLANQSANQNEMLDETCDNCKGLTSFESLSSVKNSDGSVMLLCPKCKEES